MKKYIMTLLVESDTDVKEIGIDEVPTNILDGIIDACEKEKRRRNRLIKFFNEVFHDEV